jgi:hypothetical protein
VHLPISSIKNLNDKYNSTSKANKLTTLEAKLISLPYIRNKSLRHPSTPDYRRRHLNQPKNLKVDTNFRRDGPKSDVTMTRQQKTNQKHPKTKTTHKLLVIILNVPTPNPAPTITTMYYSHQQPPTSQSPYDTNTIKLHR